MGTPSPSTWAGLVERRLSTGNPADQAVLLQMDFQHADENSKLEISSALIQTLVLKRHLRKKGISPQSREDDDNPLRRLQGSDARARERLAQLAHTPPGAMGAALMESGLPAIRETASALDGTPPEGLASRARAMQGKERP